MLLHGSRSASWTQKHSYRCATCLKKTFGSVPAQRVNQIGGFPDTLHGSTRSWFGWVNQAFIGPLADRSDDGGLFCSEEVCAAVYTKLVPFNMVLDRMPNYLVVSHGFENVGDEQLHMRPTASRMSSIRERNTPKSVFHKARDSNCLSKTSLVD